MIISHNFEDAPLRRIGMLLPLGEWKHIQLKDAKIGTIVSDPRGWEARIVAKTTVLADSEIAECLSQQLYGLPIKGIRARMERKWAMDDDKLIYLVIELL